MPIYRVELHAHIGYVDDQNAPDLNIVLLTRDFKHVTRLNARFTLHFSNIMLTQFELWIIGHL